LSIWTTPRCGSSISLFVFIIFLKKFIFFVSFDRWERRCWRNCFVPRPIPALTSPVLPIHSKVLDNFIYPWRLWIQLFVWFFFHLFLCIYACWLFGKVHLQWKVSKVQTVDFFRWNYFFVILLNEKEQKRFMRIKFWHLKIEEVYIQLNVLIRKCWELYIETNVILPLQEMKRKCEEMSRAARILVRHPLPVHQRPRKVNAKKKKNGKQK
jgi:hypothetical protein